MKAKKKVTSKAEPGRNEEAKDFVEECRDNMLLWPNPVEFVNNMYGSHAGMNGSEYFEKVFPKRRKR